MQTLVGEFFTPLSNIIWNCPTLCDISLISTTLSYTLRHFITHCSTSLNSTVLIHLTTLLHYDIFVCVIPLAHLMALPNALQLFLTFQNLIADYSTFLHPTKLSSTVRHSSRFNNVFPYSPSQHSTTLPRTLQQSSTLENHSLQCHYSTLYNTYLHFTTPPYLLQPLYETFLNTKTLFPNHTRYSHSLYSPHSLFLWLFPRLYNSLPHSTTLSTPYDTSLCSMILFYTPRHFPTIMTPTFYTTFPHIALH